MLPQKKNEGGDDHFFFIRQIYLVVMSVLFLSPSQSLKVNNKIADAIRDTSGVELICKIITWINIFLCCHLE